MKPPSPALAATAACLVLPATAARVDGAGEPRAFRSPSPSSHCSATGVPA